MNIGDYGLIFTDPGGGLREYFFGLYRYHKDLFYDTISVIACVFFD